MTQLQAIQQQIDKLQQQHDSLLQEYATIELAYFRQQEASQAWRQTRTKELIAEAKQQLRAQALQNVFYRIAERATAGLSFFEFAKVVHGLLGELIYAQNFYLALYNREKHTLDFPYFIDEHDGDTAQRNDVPYRNGLTEFVLRTAQPQLIDQARFKALQRSGEVGEASGNLNFSSWLGVPLQIQGAISGVLVVQSYEQSSSHTQNDVDILSFFASHCSNAIERYQTIDELRKSEIRYRTLIEKVGLGVVVMQGGRIVFVNPSIENTTGYSMAYLVSHPFFDIVHPDDKAGVIQRNAQRREKTLSPGFCARIVTALGQLRSLEFSAVNIQWNKHPAALLFAVDITERLQAEEAQRVALQEQTELNAVKSRFISMASHEFRTPLATIHGSVELLRHYDARLSAEKKYQTLVKIEDAVQRMSDMLESVLLMGHTNTSQMSFKPQPLALVPFFQTLFTELLLGADQHKDRVKLVTNSQLSEQVLWLDATLLHHVFSNLVSNAFKYTPNHAPVTVTARLNQTQLTISVADRGIGIPAADLPHLFTHFHRASNVGLLPGTGLGLSIAKDAVRLHGGEITVSSQEGAGSCFTVHLPTKVCK